MADGGGLSIGTLSGQIELDDKFTATIHLSTEALDELERRFGGTHDSALKVAEGMFTAEVAIEAVKEIAHLAGEALKEMTIEGARVADVEENFGRLTKSVGEMGDELLGDLRVGTHSTITDFELMKSVNDNLAAGVNITKEQYTTLATGAFALAQAKGIEVKDAFERINDALLTGRVRGVQYLTGKIDLAAAEDRFAAKLGTSSDRLNAEEKIMAAREAILGKVGDATKRLGDQQDGLDEKVAQTQVIWHNFQEDLGKTIATSPVILQSFDDIKQILTEAFGSDREEAIQNVTHVVEEMARATVTVVEVGTDVVEFMVEWKEVLEPLGVAVVAYYTAAYTAEKATVAWEVATVALEGGVAGLAAPLGIVTVAAGLMYAAFELGHWQPISDFFEKLGLEVFSGMSGAEADAAVAAHHLADEQMVAAKAAEAHAKAATEVKMTTEEWKAVVATIDPILDKYGQELLDAGQNAAKVADETGLSAEQVRAMQYEMAEAAKTAASLTTNEDSLIDGVRLSRQELKQYLDAWTDLNSIGRTYEDTLKGVRPEILDSVRYYADVGASVKDLTAAFPSLTKAQAEAAVAGKKAAEEIDKGWIDIFAKQAKMHGDNINAFIELETKRYNFHIKQLTDEGKATEAALAKERADYTTTIDAEIQKRAEQNTQTRQYYQKQYDDAKASYDLLAKLGTDVTADELRRSREEMNEKRRNLEHWRSSAYSALHDVGSETDKFASQSEQAFDSVADAINAMNEGLDASKIKVHTLAGEIISLQEAEARHAMGGSFDVTSANFAKSLQGYVTAGGANPTGMGMNQFRDPYELAKKGYSYEEVLRYAFNKDYQGPLPPAKGPRIPGFREGGVGDFGEGTIAVLHGREAIIPLDQHTQPLGGGDTILNFYVNGTGQQVAQEIKGIIMRELKSQHQFGAA